MDSLWESYEEAKFHLEEVFLFKKDSKADSIRGSGARRY